MKWTRQSALIAGLALIGMTNLAALGGAAYNRSGEPDSVLSLTQRELRPAYATVHRKNENSGMTLPLRWRVLPSPKARKAYGLDGEGGGAPDWLDAGKMASLGFQPMASNRTDTDEVFGYRRQLTREVFLVLEFDGPTYQRACEDARDMAQQVENKNERGDGRKDAQAILDQEERYSSRLFAVDAGLDREALRAKYPDRRMYAIVRGQVAPTWGPSAWSGEGAITRLSTDDINVPLEMRVALEGVRPKSYRQERDDGSQFAAEVAFGQRLEPWLISVTRQ